MAIEAQPLRALVKGQDKLCEAAGEFEWAKKLLPGHPDPRVNLALVMERAGRTDEAVASYEAALECWPDYLPAMSRLGHMEPPLARPNGATLEWLEK